MRFQLFWVSNSANTKFEQKGWNQSTTDEEDTDDQGTTFACLRITPALSNAC